MSEQHRRCRLWPSCAIHLGRPVPRTFTTTAYAQMRAERAEGATLAELAAGFEANIATVARIVAGIKPRRRRRRYQRAGYGTAWPVASSRAARSSSPAAP